MSESAFDLVADVSELRKRSPTREPHHDALAIESKGVVGSECLGDPAAIGRLVASRVLDDHAVVVSVEVHLDSR
jgi:hypothetical protein